MALTREEMQHIVWEVLHKPFIEDAIRQREWERDCRQDFRLEILWVRWFWLMKN